MTNQADGHIIQFMRSPSAHLLQSTLITVHTIVLHPALVQDFNDAPLNEITW